MTYLDHKDGAIQMTTIERAVQVAADKQKIIKIQGLSLWVYYGLDHGTRKPPYLARQARIWGMARDGA